ncbi:MAG: M48 family metalloprotease [Kiritimatiellia bacterium]
MPGYILATVLAILLPFCIVTLANLLNLKSFSPDIPQQFREICDPELYARNRAYLRTRTGFAVLRHAISVLILVGLLLTGTLQRLDAFAQHWGGTALRAGLIFLGILGVGFYCLSVLFSAWRTFVIEQRFGFNKTTPETFVLDAIKGLMLLTVVGTPVLAGLLFLFDRTGTRAWLYAWALMSAVALIWSYAAPRLIMPLFNKFTPLPEGELRSAILSLLHAHGFHPMGVYLMDGSRRSSKTNAFVTGVGRSRRLILFDTLLERHTIPELVAVVAHELGHLQKKHVLIGLAGSIAAWGFFLWLFTLFLRCDRFFHAWGFEQVSLHVALLLFYLVTGPLILTLELIANAVSRRLESAADRFAAGATGDPASMVIALKKLTLENLSNLTPHPLKVLLAYSHPPILERIRAITGSSRSDWPNGRCETSRTAKALTIIGAAALMSYALPTRADWHVPSAMTRARMVRSEGAASSTIGSGRIWPHGFAPQRLGIRIFTESGSPAPCEVLWAADGEALLVRFDASAGAKVYLAYLTPDGTGDSLPWEPKGGLVLETRRRAEGSADNWQQASKVWRESNPILGKSLVDSIYHGIHPHGPTLDFVARYSGYLRIEKPGKYSFATVSDDASFLLINSRIVAMWPGWHDVHGGRYGQHSGTIDLNSGFHKIEYLNIQAGEGFSVAAAWKPPGRDHFEIIPPEAFVQTARYEIERYESAPGRPARPCVAWELIAHSQVDDLSLVTVRLEVISPSKAVRHVWRFDDGTEAAGATVRHVFPGTGIRVVQVEATVTGNNPVTVTERIGAHPVWTQRNEWPEKVYERQREELLARDFFHTPPRDLDFLTRFALRIQDRELATKLGGAALERLREFGSSEAQMFKALALHFQHYAVRDYAWAQRCFEAAMTLSPTNSPVRAVAAVHYAGLLIHCFIEPDRAQRLLDSAQDSLLPPMEQRLKQIYRGDLLLAIGQPEAARQVYRQAGTAADRTDRQYLVRRRARLEAARDFVKRGEYDAAETIIREIEWETPLERLDTETGLIMVGVHIGRKEYLFAYAHCLRLLNVAPVDRHTPELLLSLAQVCDALKRKEETQRVLERLFKEFPYSEAAAKAQELWGKKPVAQ